METVKTTRKNRVPRIKLSVTDGNANTKAIAENAYLMCEAAYKRLMQICNGKKVRGSKDKGNYQEFPLETMSDARRKHYEDRFAALHAHAFDSLEHGRKMDAVTVAVPD